MSLFYEDNILSISLSYIWSSTIHIQQYNNNIYKQTIQYQQLKV